jgi:hypothetical protein
MRMICRSSMNVALKKVVCTDEQLILLLEGGQEVRTPLWHYPRLLNATPDQRNHYEIMQFGIHWPEIDEDLSIQGILEGRKAPNAQEVSN